MGFSTLYGGFIVRLNSDGSLDNSFGVNGLVTSGFLSDDSYRSVALQPDGKILVCGETNTSDILLARYDEIGNPDISFADSGRVVTDINIWDVSNSIVVQNDGKILVGGNTTSEEVIDGPYDHILLRYNGDGTLDNSFGLNGYTITDFGNSDSRQFKITVESSGKIITGGWVKITATNYDFLLARYNKNGTLDHTFGINGIIIKDVDSIQAQDNDAIYSIALQSDGKIVATGKSDIVNSTQALLLTRYTSGDQLKSNFYLSWLDARSGSGHEIYAQKLDGNGVPFWTQNGIPVSNSITAYASDASTHQLLFNGSSMISTWRDTRAGADGIYAQSISPGGQLQWNSTGIMVTDIASEMHLVSYGNTENGSSVILTFWGIGDPPGTGVNIYAKRLSQDGTLPVELKSFTATVNGSVVTLKWRTETEVNNYGFDIERALLNSPSAFQNPKFAKIGFAPGNGNSNSPKNYSYVDHNPPFTKVAYRLKQIDTDGSYSYSDVVEVDIGIPDKFELAQNYPNPFNPVTNIRFKIASSGIVSLKVYDILGSEVATLVNEDKQSGNYSIDFNASSLASGIYIYKLQTSTFNATKKMVLMK